MGIAMSGLWLILDRHSVGAHTLPDGSRCEPATTVRSWPILTYPGQHAQHPDSFLAPQRDQSGQASEAASGGAVAAWSFALERICAEAAHASKRRMVTMTPATNPKRAIARFANREQEAPPVRTRCAQLKPLYGEMNRWYPSMAAIAKIFMCLVGRPC